MEAALADARRLGDRGPVISRLAPDNDVYTIDRYGLARAPLDPHLAFGFGISLRAPTSVLSSWSAE